MSTLLLRLAGPLQSWGTDSKFDIRKTGREPSKSGVIGLVAAALGRKRTDSLDDLCGLRFGVRVDREGLMLCDFHMARGAKASYVTYRYYLSDAVFLAGLEGEDALLEEIESALWRPAFPLFLGRRSCPPEGRLSLGVRRGIPLEQALAQEPRLAAGTLEQAALRTVMDAKPGEYGARIQRDVPCSFDQANRVYTVRSVRETQVPCSNGACGASTGKAVGAANQTLHDPLSELGG